MQALTPSRQIRRVRAARRTMILRRVFCDESMLLAGSRLTEITLVSGDYTGLVETPLLRIRIPSPYLTSSSPAVQTDERSFVRTFILVDEYRRRRHSSGHELEPNAYLHQADQDIRLLVGMGVAGDAHLGKTVQHRSRVAKDPSQPNLRQAHMIHAELHDNLRGACPIFTRILTVPQKRCQGRPTGPFTCIL